jgi:ribosomal protein S27AE
MVRPDTGSSKRSTESDLSHVPLMTHARLRRQHLVEMRAEGPRLTARARALCAAWSEAGATPRHLLRQRAAELREAAELDAEVARLQSAHYDAAFEGALSKYARAQGQHLIEAEAPKRRRCGDGAIANFVTREYDNTSTLVAEYLTQVHGQPPRFVIDHNDTCSRCGCALVLLASKSLLACQRCGHSLVYLDATVSSTSYGDEVEFASFSYKRLNHFNEWLQQVQAKESFDVDAATVRRVMAELHRQRLQPAQISQRRVREVLKTLRLRRAYEHVAQVTMRITGRPPLRLTPDEEELCRLCFIAVQPAFEKHCPAERKNFLSYSYILYKFFELLGYDQFLDSLSLLKGRDKLSRQDDIFKKICVELDWQFIPSI